MSIVANPRDDIRLRRIINEPARKIGATTVAVIAALAAQQLNALAQKVNTRKGQTLIVGADVRDYVAAQCSKEKGAAGLAAACEQIFRALSEYCLQTDAKLTGTVALTAQPEGVWFSLNGAEAQPLAALLPAEYTGAVDAIRHADTLIIGGTSLVVYPAAGLIRYFRGDNLVVINMQPTGADASADLCIAKPIGQVLSEDVVMED